MDRADPCRPCWDWGYPPDFADVVSMGNAHWVRFVAADMPDGTLRWRLVDYNHGPALADTDQWEHPAL